MRPGRPYSTTTFEGWALRQGQNNPVLEAFLNGASAYRRDREYREHASLSALIAQANQAQVNQMALRNWHPVDQSAFANIDLYTFHEQAQKVNTPKVKYGRRRYRECRELWANREMMEERPEMSATKPTETAMRAAERIGDYVGLPTRADTEQIAAIIDKETGLAEFRYAVYSGAEKIDLGDKRVACLCQSEAQAKHMALLWAPYGYYEEV